MTEDEFLRLRGVGGAASGAGIDRYAGANMTRMTERQRRRTYEEINQENEDYYNRRAQARQEYRDLIDRGVIRDKTPIERTITAAHGNPDNAATQAARRMAEKRGYDWRTGRRLKRQCIEEIEDRQQSAATYSYRTVLTGEWQRALVVMFPL